MAKSRARPNLRAVEAPRPVHWEPQTFLGASFVRRDGRQLLLVVYPESRGILALEAPSRVKGQSDEQAIGMLFSDHKHKLVHTGAELPSLGAALELAEAYGEQWRKGAAVEVDPCGCTDIGESKS